jgi:serine/threonine protein kinase
MEQNPHIVRYLDMLKTVNNFYFVYEYCNGGTLEKLMQQYRNSPEKVMPLKTSMLYFRDIIDAFKTLTKNNIMHRDLKPDNILLHNGVIKIADFGFCKTLKSPTDLAQTMLGSPIYMAPEVITGEVYTMKADIWSLGVVLFEMVYGKCPFNESSIAKLIQILQTQELEVPFQVPEVVETLIRRMLVKDPARRIDWADLFEYRILETG